MKMKKWFALALALVMFVSLFCLSVSAAGSCRIETSSSSISTGQRLTVRVTYSADGAYVGSVQALLQYNDKVLRYDSGKDTSGGAGAVNIISVCSSPTESSIVITVNFTAIAAGSSAITVSTTEFTDYDFNFYTVGTTTANVSVVQGSDPIPDPVDPASPAEPIPVVVDGKEKNLIPVLSNVEVPADFEVAEDEYDGQVISVARGVNQDILLVYITEKDGTGGAFYAYDRDTGAITVFRRISADAVSYLVKTPEEGVEIPAGWEPYSMLYGDQQYPAYKNSDPGYAGFYMLYLSDPSGKTGFYLYDADYHTVQRYTLPKNAVIPTGGENGDIADLWTRLTADKAVFAVVVGLLILLIIVGAGWIVYMAVRRASVPSKAKNERREKKMQKKLERIEKKNAKLAAKNPEAGKKPEISTFDEADPSLVKFFAAPEAGGEKADKKAAKQAKKEAKLKEKEQAKEAERAFKEAEIAEKEAAKQAKIAEKEAAKQAKLAEKEAKKAEKAAKEDDFDGPEAFFKAAKEAKTPENKPETLENKPENEEKEPENEEKSE